MALRKNITTGLGVVAGVLVAALAAGLWSFPDRPEERAVAPNPPTVADNPNATSADAHSAADAAAASAIPPGLGGGLVGGSQAPADTTAQQQQQQQQGALNAAGTSTPPTSGTGAGAGQLGLADQNFVTSATAMGLYEVSAARSAAQKATDLKVREFAEMLVQHHSAANEQLKVLATKKNVTVPTEVPAGKKPTLDRLAAAQGHQFDRQFVETVGIADHKDDISMFERAAREARDPEIKAFAERTLPTLKAHLAAAQKLPVSAPPATGAASR